MRLKRSPAAPRKRRFRRLKLGRALFVLPNAFTVASIFFGFYSIAVTTGSSELGRFRTAALAIFLAAFCDMFDGRVARLTRTQSDFGVQLDSLADLVSFGVAPAVLVHRWGMNNLGSVGIIVSFCLVACGAIRLARFNVMSVRRLGSSRFFIGLPIPAAATLLITLVLFHQAEIATQVVAQAHIATLVLILSYLMVSNVRYRSFKAVRPTLRTLSLLALLLALFFSLGLLLQPSAGLLAATSTYVTWGLLEEVLFFRRRRSEERSLADSVAAVPVNDSGAKELQ